MGLLDTITNSPNKLFGSGQGVTANVVPLDDQTNQLISAGVNRATAPSDQVANNLNAGVGDSTSSLAGPSVDQRAAKTGENAPMLQAIKNQYNQVAGKDIQRITNQNRINADVTKSQWLKQYAAGAMAQQNVATQNYASLTNAYNQSQMARAQVLSSILGLGGVAVGIGASRGRRSSGSMGGSALREPQLGESAVPQGEYYGGQGTLGEFNF